MNDDNRIGLLDVDGHNFPNLPLMKISSFYKSKGFHIEFVNALLGEYEKVYMSKIFTSTPDYMYPIRAKEVIFGGTGYAGERPATFYKDNKLPDAIEHSYPDYNLYRHKIKDIENTAYGFLTRGCPRNCGFCAVSLKEGCKSIKVADLSEFWRGQKFIKLLDPNILACSDRAELIEQLIESRAYIDFSQGLDARLINEEVTDMIMRCNLKMIHFAWDKEKDSSIICRKLKEFKKQTNINIRKAKVYILTNYDTSFEFDLYRVYELKNLGYDPYVMVFDKENAKRQYRLLQRWVNNKIIFRVCEKFEEYKPELG